MRGTDQFSRAFRYTFRQSLVNWPLSRGYLGHVLVAIAAVAGLENYILFHYLETVGSKFILCCDFDVKTLRFMRYAAFKYFGECSAANDDASLLGQIFVSKTSNFLGATISR